MGHVPVRRDSTPATHDLSPFMAPTLNQAKILLLSPAGCLLGRHSRQRAEAIPRLLRHHPRARSPSTRAATADAREKHRPGSGSISRAARAFSASSRFAVESYEAGRWLRYSPFPCLAARRTLDQERSTQFRPDGSAATIHRVDGSRTLKESAPPTIPIKGARPVRSMHSLMLRNCPRTSRMSGQALPRPN